MSESMGYGGNVDPLLSKDDNNDAWGSYNPSHLENHFYFPHLNNDDRDQDDDAQTAYQKGNLKRKRYSPSPPSLGLRLTRTPELLQKIEEKLNGSVAETIAPCPPPTKKDTKLKPGHFPMQSLKIGSFAIEAEYAEHLVAKCYYAKQKLVWEILRNGLKEKIEIHWQKILALGAVTGENELGILEIELDEVPSFSRENELKSKKQTSWVKCEDFTAGQASKHRRHYLQFPPGVLDQHYATLLQYDNRLLELSQKPFPSLECPYFDSHVEQGSGHFHFGHDQHIQVLKNISASDEQQPTFELPVVSAHQPLQQFGTMTPLSLPTSGISSSINDPTNNQMLQGQWQNSWNQGLDCCETSFSKEYVPSASHLQQNGSGLNYELPSHINEIVFDKRHMGNILQSTSAIADLPMEASPAYNTNTSTQIDWPNTNGSGEQYYTSNANLNSMHGNPFGDQRCLFYPEELITFPPEV